MAVQNLTLQKGAGAFLVAGVPLSVGIGLGSPYPGTAIEVDFTVGSLAEKAILDGSNHPTTPQYDSTHPTAAFLYSTWT